MTAGGQPRRNVIQSVAYPNCETARLYATAFEAVSELGFIITARDDAAMTLGFRPATPTGSWPYEQMTAAVLADGSGARIALSGAPAGGPRLQMGQWREGHAIAMMVLDRMKSVLGG
jgi:hypothetical protein